MLKVSSSLLSTAWLALVLFCFSAWAGDVLVTLNVNRPYNDVSEKFVSFAVRPEDMYKALDGPQRKSMTRMASMLGESYIKFVGDYYFTTKAESKLRNPTRIIWKGFNRWTKAVNWTMIIPVPYTPSSWDPMLALKILNSSYLLGISDCIWQLGNDFTSARAQEYVAELNTLNLMVDSFKPYVNEWQIMGADISAGSSVDETRRYIGMSRELNAAFGWTQPAELSPANSMGSYIYDNDPALKLLIKEKVPVWLSLPHRTKPKKNNLKYAGTDVVEGLRWAHTLGEAASSGFNAVFKKISLSDLEKPSFSFYVTALFKKVMGSRVFPARPLNMFARQNKLYTHCANAVSGGVAFLVINPDESPIQISVRSQKQFTGTEYWQYTLTSSKGHVLLNNEKLSLNSTLAPQIKVKNADRPVHLSTPGMSVSFWILPSVNLEHCHFTEVEEEELEHVTEGGEEKVLQKRFSSSERLLKKLIQEQSATGTALSRLANRGRRYATFADRQKRFILEDKEAKDKGFLGRFLQPFGMDDKLLAKREIELPGQHGPLMQWLKDLWDNYAKDQGEHRQLKRERRSTHDYFGTMLSGKGSRKLPFIRKITEIKKPERKVKPIFDLNEFDEEQFFKQMDEESEPEYQRLPEGDVHLKHITNLDGEEEDEEKKKPSKSKILMPPETKSEMKPLRLLPTEFYEALPNIMPASNKMSIGSTLNSLLFAEPFSKKAKGKNKKLRSKSEQDVAKESQVADEHEHEHDIEAVSSSNYASSSGHLAADFLRAQEQLSKTFTQDNAKQHDKADAEKKESLEAASEAEADAEEEDTEPPLKEKVKQLLELDESPLDAEKAKKKRKYIDYLGENLDNYFTDNDDLYEDKHKRHIEDIRHEIEDIPWWEISATLRKRREPRALNFQIPDEAWVSNAIDKDEELKPLGADPLDLYETFTESVQKVQENVVIAKKPPNLVTTVKEKVTKFVDIVARHVSDWYSTLTKHIEGADVKIVNKIN